jgi:hypothetical protein
LKETSNNGKFIISGSSLASGFYVYEVSTKGWSSQGKLIVD